MTVRKGGNPQAAIPVCSTMVSQLAGEKGVIRPNEYSLRQKGIDFTIEDAEYKEIKDEQLNDEPEAVSVCGLEENSGGQTTGIDSGMSEE